MSAALHLAGRYRVALVTKRELLDGASSWAQGGIAAVLDSSDSVEEHIRDT
ncbi:MAG TPA: FAD-binding protein, partial [Usitatibacter sp.]|nr:FAD-binding protein [Usitatibacter sp.]